MTLKHALFKGFQILLLIIVCSVGFFVNRNGFNDDRTVKVTHVRAVGTPEVELRAEPSENPLKSVPDRLLPKQEVAVKKKIPERPFKSGDIWDPGFVNPGQMWASGSETRVVIRVDRTGKRKTVATVPLHIIEKREWSVSESAGWADTYVLNTTNYGNWHFKKYVELKE